MPFSNTQEVFSRLPDILVPDAAKGIDAVFQFDIQGRDGGAWYVKVQDGSCAVEKGLHDSPRVTITTSSENWLALVNRKLNAVQAFLTGKLKIKGDIMFAQKIYSLFNL